jgi:hypothetical protein
MQRNGSSRYGSASVSRGNICSPLFYQVASGRKFQRQQLNLHHASTGFRSLDTILVCAQKKLQPVEKQKRKLFSARSLGSTFLLSVDVSFSSWRRDRVLGTLLLYTQVHGHSLCSECIFVPSHAVWRSEMIPVEGEIFKLV